MLADPRFGASEEGVDDESDDVQAVISQTSLLG
jgi:hypothetical protein